MTVPAGRPQHHSRFFSDDELIYAATARCQCGAGLAYSPQDENPDLPYKGPSAWDCSDILTGRAAKVGESGHVQHDDIAPFAFYEIKSEEQPSANGMTTRGSAP